MGCVDAPRVIIYNGACALLYAKGIVYYAAPMSHLPTNMIVSNARVCTYEY